MRMVVGSLEVSVIPEVEFPEEWGLQLDLG